MRTLDANLYHNGGSRPKHESCQSFAGSRNAKTRKDSERLPFWEPFFVVLRCGSLWYLGVCYDMFHGHIWPSHSLSLQKFYMYFISCPILPINFDEVPSACFSIRFQYASLLYC